MITSGGLSGMRQDNTALSTGFLCIKTGEDSIETKEEQFAKGRFTANDDNGHTLCYHIIYEAN